MRVTLKDVALRAGVSAKTVSNVVNGTGRFSPEVRARVESAVAALNYVPNFSARGLRNGRSGLICLALPNLSTPYSAELIREFALAAARRDLGVQIEETGFDNYERERHLLSQARRHLVDGLIMSPVLLTSAALQPTPVTPPMVFLGEVRQDITDHVWIDNVAASREMVEHLIGLGHRRIAMLGRFVSESARLRRKGYRQALRAAGLTPSADLEIPNPTWTTAAAAAALDEYLDRRPVPDAIFCLTDSQALGALNTLWRRGIRVPDDVSVAGYDDITDGRYAVPPLTTVGIDKARLAEAAIDLLLDRIADPRRRPRRVTIPYRILPRASSKPAPH